MLECPSSNRSQESTVPSPKASSESTTMNVPRGKVIPSYNPSYALETPCHAMYQQSLSEVKSSVPSTISLTSDTSSPLHVKYHQLPQAYFPCPSPAFSVLSKPSHSSTLKQYYHDNRNRYPSVAFYYSQQTTGRLQVSRSSCCQSAYSVKTCIYSLRSGRDSSLVDRGDLGR